MKELACRFSSLVREVRVRLTSVVAYSVLSVSIIAGRAVAQSQRDAILVTPDWVATHLHDANTVVLHVGDPKLYATKHLPGARLIQLPDISVSDHGGMQMPASASPEPLQGPKNGLILEMPTADQLRSQFSKFGISDNTKVIVYSANGFITPMTRVVFTFDYAGLGKNVVVMNGGLEAWVAENRAVTDAIPREAKPGKLSALAIRPLVVDANYVNAHAKAAGVSIVDARATTFYEGAARPGQPGRPGHIPGAKSVPFSDVTTADGTLKPNDQLTALFAKAGVQPADTVVAYCHIGQQATATLFAARLLGHPVLLYDGSYTEWEKLTQFPVENPSAKKP